MQPYAKLHYFFISTIMRKAQKQKAEQGMVIFVQNVLSLTRYLLFRTTIHRFFIYFAVSTRTYIAGIPHRRLSSERHRHLTTFIHADV